MDEDKHAAYRAHVEQLSEKLRLEMFLQEWTQRIDFEYKPRDSGTIAEILINLPYLEYTLKLPKRFRKLYYAGEDWQLCNVLAHELSHIFTEPLYAIAVNSVTNHTDQLVSDIRERQTQRIANLVMANLDEDFYGLSN